MKKLEQYIDNIKEFWRYHGYDTSIILFIIIAFFVVGYMVCH